MLQAIRSKAASVVVKALFVLLILSFGVWGIADYVGSSSRPTVVATVGGAEIDPMTISNAINSELQRLRQMLGGSFERDQAKAFGVVDRVIENVVARAVVEQAAQRQGVLISDDTLRLLIRNDPLFQSNGQFDPERFQQVLARAGYNEARFVAELRRDAARNQLLRAVSSGSEAPQVLTDQIIRHRFETRVALVATVKLDASGEIPAPTDEQLAKFHQDNAQRFTAPEYRRLTWVSLSPADLAPRIEISDAELRDAYQQRLDELSRPETRSVEQVLLPDEAAAKAAVTAYPEADAIVLGEVTREELPTELAEVVFGAPAAGMVGPIRTGLGWHVLKVVSITPEHRPSLDEVRDRLTQELRSEKAADQVYTVSNRIEDALATGMKLEDAAKQFGMTLGQTAEADRRGRDAAGADAKVPGGDALLTSAFGLESGRTSRLLEQGESYFAVRVDAITPAALRPLDTVRDQVVQAWTRAEQDQRAKARAESIAAALKEGKTPEDVTLEPSAPFTREATGTDLPPQIVSALFGGPVGTLATAQRGDAWLVAQLAEIKPVTAEELDKRRAEIGKTLRQALSEDMLQQFQQALRRDIPVTIDQKAVDQLF